MEVICDLCGQWFDEDDLIQCFDCEAEGCEECINDRHCCNGGYDPCVESCDY